MHYEVLTDLLSQARDNTDVEGDRQRRKRRDAWDMLAKAEAVMFRRSTDIAMYIASDRYDAQFTIEGLASDMHNPTRISISRMRRLVRYFRDTSGEHLLCVQM